MDLPTALTIAVGTITAGGIGMKLFGNNSKGKGVSPKQCLENREEIQRDLERGEKKFEKLFEAVQEQGETLARIDERTLIWAKKNGLEK